MQKLHFITEINAPREKVWRVLWDDKTYREWTSAFAEGSFAETDWQEGSKALFLTPDRSGMASRIKENRPNEFLSIKHLGIVKEGVEDYDSEEIKEWAGSLENYTLEDHNGGTRLRVDLDSTDEFREYMQTTFPKALEKVKELAEGKAR